MTRNAIDSLTEGNIHLKYFKGYLCFLLNILSDSCWLILLIECISLEVLTDRTAIPGHPRQSQGRLGTEDNSAGLRMVRGGGEDTIKYPQTVINTALSLHGRSQSFYQNIFLHPAAIQNAIYIYILYPTIYYSIECRNGVYSSVKVLRLYCYCWAPASKLSN